MLSRGHSRCSCLRRRSRIIIYNSRYWQSSAGIVRDDTFVGARWEDDSSRPTGGPSSNTTISDLSIDTNLNRNGGSSALLYTQQKHLTTPWSSCQNHRHQLQNTHNIAIRHNSSSSASSSSITEQLTSILPPTPEYLTNATIWGATGLLLTNFHIYLHLPYWACISLTNVCVRSAMIPIAIRGAKTSVKFGNISPEVQYLITNFTNDMRALKMRGIMSQVGSFTRQQSERGQRLIIKTTWQSLRGLFRMNKVNLLDIFKVRLHATT